MKRLTVVFFAVCLFSSVQAVELYQSMMQYQADRSALRRKYSNSLSAEYYTRILELYSEWTERLKMMDYDSLSEDGKLDWLVFRNNLEKEIYFTRADFLAFTETAQAADFSAPLEKFYADRRRAIKPDSQGLASVFHGIKEQVALKMENMKQSRPYSSWQQADLAAGIVAALTDAVDEAYYFYYDYDPDFSWWMKKPWEDLKKALLDYEAFLRNFFVNTEVKDDGSGIIGRPIGRKALEKELQFEFIPYTPEQLIKEAEKQFAWCEAEMRKAAKELGFINDWKEALEYVKNRYVPPGVWPQMTAEMAEEAVDFLEYHDLITVPEMAKETWRTSMMSAEAQRINPFFLGGERIQISYPTSEMSHEEKMMSMRGNNPHFSRAVVHHELIPGHHLQQFMNQRHHPHRRGFGTAFWTEGWALYWEFTLWDKGFASTPEDRIGMLFWRMHRCARIIFSLNYHLEKMSPQECIDFLVEKVGHERANAEAEVRRSFTGRYGPLYQIAYMIGGLQFYAMRKELVDSGQMAEKAFHDFIIRQNNVPVELLRARIKGMDLPADYQTQWKFLDGLQKTRKARKSD